MALALPAAGQPLRNSLAARINAVPRCIIYPDVEDGTTFEIKPHILNILPSFHGLPNSDPNMHLADFIEACDNIIIRCFSSEAIKLRLFPFSLNDKAKAWLHSLPANSITTWTELQENFLNKFFPSSKTLALKKEILAFAQKPNESFHEAWERYNEMYTKCPHAGFDSNLQMNIFMMVSSMPNAQEACIICSETTHDITQCPNKDSCPELMQDHVNMVNNFIRPRSVPYSNTYNPGWKNHPNLSWGGNQQPRQYQQSYQSTSETKKPSLEDQMSQLAQHMSAVSNSTNNFIQSTQTSIQNLTASVGNLETQVGQLATMFNEREKGKFLSQSEQNPRGMEHCKVIRTLKSGKTCDNRQMVHHEAEVEEEELTESAPLAAKSRSEAISEAGASVNLMPYSVFQKLVEGELKPTSVSLQLADRSVTYPLGILEDVIIKVDKFYLPADFIVLDMEEDNEVPLILGRPFMATAWTLIDVEAGTLTLRVQGESVVFKLFEAVKRPFEPEKCFRVDVFDRIVHANFASRSSNDELLTCLTNHDATLSMEENVVDVIAALDSAPIHNPKWRHVYESLGVPKQPLFPSSEQAPKLELKLLPSHLKYAHLGVNETLPVIIAADLNDTEEDKLLRVLRKYQDALGWTLADIKGISPALCMHRNFMEAGTKPTVEAQRHLNPIMKEVVRVGVMKLLDAGIIYPISDSKWVNPTQVVPKKTGITVVKNDNNELVPTRMTTGWRMCVDYRKPNNSTRKDHFPLPFIDQMLERLAGHSFYCFLDGYSGYNQIPIAPEDQEKTTFTSPFEVDKAKIEVIIKLPPPTSVKNDLLTSAPIITAPDWTLPFELMCDASDYVVGAVLDFMGPFPFSHGNLYILVAVDYVSKWVEAIASPTCKSSVVLGFLQNTIFPRFGVPRAIISDEETPIGMRPFRLVYGKACHWPMELEHKAYWAIKHLNFDYQAAGEKRKLQLNELEEIRNDAYENAKIYKDKTKKFHNAHILRKEFQPGQKVLLFNSRLKLFPGKLKSRWNGPYRVVQVHLHGAVDIQNMQTGFVFKVNGHRLKLYKESPYDLAKDSITLKEPVI
ncbi:unnamed protein product [Malus baccata var. baccata]